MAINTLTPQIAPIAPNELKNSVGAKSLDPAAGGEFRKTLEQLTAALPGTQSGAAIAAPVKTAAASALKFSAHAVDRMRTRGVMFSPEQMKSIESAVGKAAQKGSRETLVLTPESALIVNIKNNTVVTVMDREAMKNNVFTNIDSTVMV